METRAQTPVIEYAVEFLPPDIAGWRAGQCLAFSSTLAGRRLLLRLALSCFLTRSPHLPMLVVVRELQAHFGFAPIIVMVLLALSAVLSLGSSSSHRIWRRLGIESCSAIFGASGGGTVGLGACS